MRNHALLTKTKFHQSMKSSFESSSTWEAWLRKITIINVGKEKMERRRMRRRVSSSMNQSFSDDFN
ncbi:hypothetical protein NC652_019496 [Populus alba x Populus x berolinensis]|uniref:Uncharacterized protein n=1 Tax=Populus alba x Populus x berolinensis TaxID=444605 RepID=A0AAD6VX27_9ROSI|nr:hypothetical protein NC652_019496 [Populus alba x Populus x berolinensis]KAJ6991080.1 hypothetical protein NC653_019329 [Populus alba x Populus x berolinensis]